MYFCTSSCLTTNSTRGQLRSRTAMELIYSVNLMFIFAVNILFMFPGICLNCLVILSFWRSRQLAKKLCYFTVMILSCCDVIVVLTSHPLTALACYVVVILNEFNIQLLNLLLEKQDFTKRGNENYQRDKNMSRNQIAKTTTMAKKNWNR